MRRQPLTRHHTLFFCLLVAPILHATTATAGGFVVSGQSDGLYDGDEWSELLRSVATIVVILAASHEDEDDDADFLCHGGPHYHHDDACDELGFSVPQVQLSAGMGYALSRRLTIGARYLYRHDRRDNDIARLWGGGPEATLLFSDGSGTVHPFVGGYLLFARGERREDGRALAQGTSMGLQTGLRLMMSEDASWLLQWGFQIDRFPDLVDAPLQSRGATIGLGLRLALQ